MINHLWQSTLFAVVAGLLTVALRRNRAQVRYWIWFSASLKFLVPFALLISLGSHVESWTPQAKKFDAPPAVSFAMERIAQPFSVSVAPVARGNRDWAAIAMLGVWACGFVAIGLMRFRDWLRIRAALRSSSAMDAPAAVEVRSSPGLLEPGVVGFVRPILLLPEGIAERLTQPQLEAVLAHELCHVRRRDNLFASMHMIVEAVFWFHPLVWWIGAKLIEERERACDEAVLKLGSAPRDYAEALVNVCKLYVESPLACVSGVTGSDIRKRIHAILAGRVAGDMSFAKKFGLAVAGILALIVPIGVGVLNAPRLLARPQEQSQSSVEAATAKPQVTPPAHRLIAQAQTTPPQAGRGVISQAAPAKSAAELHSLRLAEAKEKFGSASSPMARMYVRYGPPDQIDDRSTDAQNPSQIWRYNYLGDFRSNVEVQFAPGKAMQITSPPPVTFQGEAGVSAAVLATIPAEFFHGSEPPAANTIAGFPGGDASMQIYPARSYRMLSVPIGSLSGGVDIAGVIRTSAGQTLQSAEPDITLGVRDFIILKQPGPAPSGSFYTATFTLDPGSYVCSVLVRQQTTGMVYGETISFEAK
ncbi:MAG TPA: M56 family metallopeptidase [Bryobacteraceae bacterium]|jgi:beta-lactamase regulating signal transducer with metallopeptidase domain